MRSEFHVDFFIEKVEVASLDPSLKLLEVQQLTFEVCFFERSGRAPSHDCYYQTQRLAAAEGPERQEVSPDALQTVPVLIC